MTGDWLDRLARRVAGVRETRPTTDRREGDRGERTRATLLREAALGSAALVLAGAASAPARAAKCSWNKCMDPFSKAYDDYIAFCDSHYDRLEREGRDGYRYPAERILALRLHCYDRAFGDLIEGVAKCTAKCPPPPKPKPPAKGKPKDPSPPPPPPPSGGEDGTCAACLAVGGVCCLGGGGVVRRGERIPPGASICGCNNPDYPCRC